MTQDDRMETITDPAAIRASDEPDERGDFPCCTTPAPVGAAVTLDLDAIEADALAALNPSRCRCTVQSGSVYSSQCPRHDPRDPGYRAPWQMPPATALALVAEVRRLTEESEARRVREMDAVDLAMSERARAEAAEADVVTLRARLAAVEAWPLTLEQVHAIVDYLLGDGSRDGLIHGDTLNRAMGASARRRAALAGTTGEGE